MSGHYTGFFGPIKNKRGKEGQGYSKLFLRLRLIEYFIAAQEQIPNSPGNFKNALSFPILTFLYFTFWISLIQRLYLPECRFLLVVNGGVLWVVAIVREMSSSLMLPAHCNTIICQHNFFQRKYFQRKYLQCKYLTIS